MLGIKEIYIEDVREEFVRDFVFPMFRANAVYEGVYLLGTSIARPLISKHLDRHRQQNRCRRDRPRRHRQGQRPGSLRTVGLCAEPRHQDHRALARLGIQEPHRPARFAEQHQIPVAKDKKGEAPFSVDANLLHSSSEGKVLEDPAIEAPEYVHMRTISPEAAPDKATVIKVGFERAMPFRSMASA
jgi:argininosuccinate synthase